jgi:hypothetical protein
MDTRSSLKNDNNYLLLKLRLYIWEHRKKDNEWSAQQGLEEILIQLSRTAKLCDYLNELHKETNPSYLYQFIDFLISDYYFMRKLIQREFNLIKLIWNDECFSKQSVKDALIEAIINTRRSAAIHYISNINNTGPYLSYISYIEKLRSIDEKHKVIENILLTTTASAIKPIVDNGYLEGYLLAKSRLGIPQQNEAVENILRSKCEPASKILLANNVFPSFLETYQLETKLPAFTRATNALICILNATLIFDEKLTIIKSYYLKYQYNSYIQSAINDALASPKINKHYHVHIQRLLIQLKHANSLSHHLTDHHLDDIDITDNDIASDGTDATDLINNINAAEDEQLSIFHNIFAFLTQEQRSTLKLRLEFKAQVNCMNMALLFFYRYLCDSLQKTNTTISNQLTCTLKEADDINLIREICTIFTPTEKTKCMQTLSYLFAKGESSPARVLLFDVLAEPVTIGIETKVRKNQYHDLGIFNRKRKAPATLHLAAEPSRKKPCLASV